MRIAYIGKFNRLYDEEYIARSFEMNGHEVFRLEQSLNPFDIKAALEKYRPDILLYAKWSQPEQLTETILRLKREGMRTVCWLFDLYFDYDREWQIRNKSFFKSDFLFTTDGGHDERWKELGINHHCVRQGIYKEHAVLLPFKEPEHEVVFVGSESPLYPVRNNLMKEVGEKFDFHWYGRKNTDELRGMDLNEVYSKTKVVIGDSFYSPGYWSNRVVETLGRGGFLIHQEVEGLSEEYPHLVTYKRWDKDDLFKKIRYYLDHEDERREIVRKNHEWVKERYTMDRKCAELISQL